MPKYADGDSRTGVLEKGYLSRLHALLVNTGLRGQFNGTESVEFLMSFLRTIPEGEKRAAMFIDKHGDGNFTKEPRTTLRTARIAPESVYE